MNSKLIYTAIYGGYDEPISYKRARGTDHRLFSDRSYQCSPWEVETIASDESPRMAAKRYKILPPEGYDATLWIDGNIRPKFGSWSDLFLTVKGTRSLAFIAHPNRDCLYEEARVCKQSGLDDHRRINAQIERYRAEGMPEHWGLWAGTIILRDDSQQVRELMKMWMEEIEKGSIRDQISLPYVLWKSGFTPGTIRGNLWQHSLFEYRGHK